LSYVIVREEIIFSFFGLSKKKRIIFISLWYYDMFIFV
jgi:hypothetical protein